MNKARIHIAFFLAVFIFSTFSCKSTPSAPATTEENVASSISLSVPIQPKVQTFQSIPADILLDVQNGTAESLKRAASALRKSDQSYTNDEAILLNIISCEMEIFYPTEKFSMQIPQVSAENIYIMVLDSAKKGIYDFNLRKPDFFLKIIPSFVLITAPNSENFYSESQLSLDSALQENPASFLANYLRGILAYRSGNFSTSSEFLRRAYELDSSYVNLIRFYADSLLKTGQNELAFQLASKILETDPNNFEFLKICSYACLNLGNLQQAEGYIVKVLQQQPNNLDFILLRSRMLMARGEYLTVSNLLDVYERSDSTSKEYLILRSTLQRDWNKNYASASSTIEQALKLYPNDTEVILFAVSLMNLTDQQIGERESKVLLNQVLSEDSGNVKAKELLLSVYVKQKEWQNAFELSSELVKNADCSQEIVLLYVETCIQLKKYNDAQKILQSFSKKSTDTASLEIAQIQVFIAQGDKFSASKQIQTSLSKENSGNVKSELYYLRSTIATSSENELSDLRLSLTSNPRNPNALFALYKYYFKKQDYRKSQYYLRQAVALDPRNSELLRLSSELENLLK